MMSRYNWFLETHNMPCWADAPTRGHVLRGLLIPNWGTRIPRKTRSAVICSEKTDIIENICTRQPKTKEAKSRLKHHGYEIGRCVRKRAALSLASLTRSTNKIAETYIFPHFAPLFTPMRGSCVALILFEVWSPSRFACWAQCGKRCLQCLFSRHSSQQQYCGHIRHL